MNLRRDQVIQTLAIFFVVLAFLAGGKLAAMNTQAKQMEQAPVSEMVATEPGPAIVPEETPVETKEPTLPMVARQEPPAQEVSRPPLAAKQPARADDWVVLGYYAEWGDDHSSYTSMEKNAASLSWVSPYWYSVDANGELKNRGGDREKVMNLARASGKKVVVLFNNLGGNDAVLQNEDARRKAAENIARVVIDKGYDGVNIDFENLEPASREGLGALMADLADRLWPAGKLVTVAVAPKLADRDDINDFAAAYDYEALCRYTDYVVIMTYDQHAKWSDAGPIADIRWVDQAVRQARSQMPAERILLGLAGYGYDWSTEGVRVVNARQAEEMAERYETNLEWDEAGQVPYFKYTDNGVDHEVWFEDARSVAAKVELAVRYKLGGVALWRLGQEEDELWSRVIDSYR